MIDPGFFQCSQMDKLLKSKFFYTIVCLKLRALEKWCVTKVDHSILKPLTISVNFVDIDLLPSKSVKPDNFDNFSLFK